MLARRGSGALWESRGLARSPQPSRAFSCCGVPSKSVARTCAPVLPAANPRSDPKVSVGIRPVAPGRSICQASATSALANRPGATEGRPPGPCPTQTRPRSPGGPLGSLSLLSLRLRRFGRSGLGLRIPHSADAVLVARGPARRRAQPGRHTGGTGGHGRQTPRVPGFPELDRLCRGQPLPGPLWRTPGSPMPRAPWSGASGRTGDALLPLRRGWGTCNGWRGCGCPV